MDLETRLFKLEDGWSAPLPKSLDSDRTVVTVFGAASFIDTPAVFGELRAAFPRAQMLGCSTAGEIHERRVHDDSIVIAVARFDAVTARVASVVSGGVDQSFEAGRSLGSALHSPDLRALFLLSEGVDVNGSAIVRGVSSVTDPSVVVTGGLAADGDRFARTWVFDGDDISTNRMVALGIYGERAVITHGSKGGWDIFGIERRVTKAKGNVLYELDGIPALKLYKEYLGDRASGLPLTALLFPLAVRADASSSKRLVRTVLAVNANDQSLTFAGDIPVGGLAQLMRANCDRLIEGASEAGKIARPAIDSDLPVLSLAVSCVGRRLVLRDRVEEESEATQDALPPRTKQVGFYAYGEISPFATGTCDLHNQTMTVTTISER